MFLFFSGINASVINYRVAWLKRHRVDDLWVGSYKYSENWILIILFRAPDDFFWWLWHFFLILIMCSLYQRNEEKTPVSFVSQWQQRNEKVSEKFYKLRYTSVYPDKFFTCRSLIHQLVENILYWIVSNVFYSFVKVSLDMIGGCLEERR